MTTKKNSTTGRRREATEGAGGWACLLTAGAGFQGAVNGFVDAFRRATPDVRRTMVNDPIETSGPLEGLVAARA